MDLFTLTLGIAFSVSIILFLYRIYVLYKYLRIGKSENRFDHPWKRLSGMLYDSITQSCSRKHKNYYPGFTHFFFFWGFIALLPSIAQLIFGPLFGFSWKFLGSPLYEILFYAEDVIIILVLLSVAMAYYRRYVIRPKKLENTFDAFLILFLVTILMITLIGHNAFEITYAYMTTFCALPWYMPVSSYFASLVISMHLSLNTVITWEYVFYWIHVLTILFFLVYIPYSKHLHLLASFPNMYFRKLENKCEIKPVDLEKAEKIGVSDIRDLTWKDYMDGMACTECGRCTDNCPAWNTGKPLNPKKIISKVKYNLYHNAPLILKNEEGIVPLVSTNQSKMEITPDEVWACTTCGSCIEQCPVYNDHLGKIIEVRRYLVMTAGDVPKEIVDFLTNIERSGNPWGFPAVKRDAVIKGKNVKLLKEKQAEYLFFIGCAGSYDSRYRNVIETLIEIFNIGGVDFGFLGREENCCGTLARRNGNEDLFQRLAKKNIETFKKYNVKKIIVACPHGYNVLKNEYKQFGGDFEVYHATEILEKLVKEGKIRLKTGDMNVTYHDPCCLGRFNGMYETPRNLIKSVSNLKEMKRSREMSFCCGGGSGKALMEEKGEERININRTKEALNMNVEAIVTTCPFCTIMLEDGVKTLNREDVKVLDVSELLMKYIEK